MVERVAREYGARLDFRLLTDAGHRVIDRYGLFNADDPRGREITHPATFVIDTAGVVRWRFVQLDYTIRPTNEQILDVLAALD